jgi:hypothetical protein
MPTGDAIFVMPLVSPGLAPKAKFTARSEIIKILKPSWNRVKLRRQRKKKLKGSFFWKAGGV